MLTANEVYKNISHTKLKNYLYEILEYVSGYFLIFMGYFGLLFITGVFSKSINFYEYPLTPMYVRFLSGFNLLPDYDSAGINLTAFYMTILLLIIDLAIILIRKKTIFDLIFDFEYHNSNKIKLIIYAFLKYFNIFILIISSKIDSSFLVFYGNYFYMYFIINLIARIATKGRQSIVFYLLNLKNI